MDLESYPLPLHMRFYIGETLGYENGSSVRLGPLFPIFNGEGLTDKYIFYLIYDDALGRSFVSATEVQKDCDMELVVRDAIATMELKLTETS